MQPEELKNLIAKFYENKISRTEYETLMNYFKQSEDNSVLDQFLNEKWQFINEGTVDYDMELIRVKLVETIKRDQWKTIRMRMLKPLFVAAASILLVAATGLFLYLSSASHKNSQSEKLISREVPYGQKVQITLSDGSVVYLNSGSRLKYPSVFNSKKREVYLEGEGFFEVKHVVSQPFLVHVKNVTTQVLGTSFNIDAYHLQQLKVSVVTGKVGVLQVNKLLSFLTPSERLEVNTLKHSYLKTKFKPENLAWINGDLIFDNITLSEGKEIMERWFNVKINFANPTIATKRFTASFYRNENIYQVLEVLATLNKFSYTSENHIITIY